MTDSRLCRNLRIKLPDGAVRMGSNKSGILGRLAPRDSIIWQMGWSDEFPDKMLSIFITSAPEYPGKIYVSEDTRYPYGFYGRTITVNLYVDGVLTYEDAPVVLKGMRVARIHSVKLSNR